DVRVERADAHTLVMTVPSAQLSDSAPRVLDTAEYMGPVLRVQMKQLAGAVRVQVDLADDVKASVRRVGSRLYWDFAKQNPGPRGNATLIRDWRAPAFAKWQQRGAAPAPAGEGNLGGQRGKKRYTGRRIDLDFKDADIHNILRLLQDVGQVNIITTDDVKG